MGSVRRADDINLYHGTSDKFDRIDTERGELGSHWGTPEQVNSHIDEGGNLDPIVGDEKKREKHLRDMRNMRVYPADIDIKNPLRLKDVGNFDAFSVAGQLMDLGIISAEDWEEIQKVGEKDRNRVIQSAIINAGYDGIIYLNRREAPGQITPEGEAMQEKRGYDWLDLESTDEEFLRAYPQAKDSYIVFEKSQIKGRWAARRTAARKPIDWGEVKSAAESIRAQVKADPLYGKTPESTHPQAVGIVQIAADGLPPTEPEPEDEPELTIEQKAQALLYEIARDSQVSGYIPETEDLEREVAGFIENETGLEPDPKWVSELVGRLEFPGWRAHPLPPEIPPGTKLNCVRVWMQRRARADDHLTANVRHWPGADGEVWALVHPDFDPQSVPQDFYVRGTFDAPLPHGMFAYIIVTGNVAGLAATSPGLRGQGLMRRLLLAVVREHGRLTLQDLEPGMRQLVQKLLNEGLVEEEVGGEVRRFDTGNDLTIRLASEKNRGGQRQSILRSWRERRAAGQVPDDRSDLQRAADDIYDFIVHNRQHDPEQIIRYLASKWGYHPRDMEGVFWSAISYLVEDEGRLRVGDRGWIPRHDTKDRQFQFLVGNIVHIVEGELKKSGSARPGELLAAVARAWPEADKDFVSQAFEHAIKWMEQEGKITWSDGVVTTTGPKPPQAPDTPAQVTEMNPVQRQTRIDALLDRWQSEPGARPQIEEQLKSLRAVRALWSVRRAVSMPKPVPVGGDYMAFPEEIGEPWQTKSWISPDGHFLPCKGEMRNHEDFADGYNKTIDQMILDGWIRVAIGAQAVLLDMISAPNPQQMAVIDQIMTGRLRHLTIGLGDSQDWGAFNVYGEFNVDELAARGEQLSDALAKFFADPESIKRERDYRALIDEHGYPREDMEQEATLLGRWMQRRAGEQKLLRELVCTVIGSDSGVTNEAVLPKGAVVGVQPWSNDRVIFFYSPIYSKIIVRGRVMKSNQYAASVQDFRAATDIGYGEGTGYEHGPECHCEECMAKDDLTTRRCPSCGSRECPGDGESIDCRKPGTMTVEDVSVETRDSLLDKFNRGEIDEQTLRRRMKQIGSRWRARRAESQAALINEVLGQITEDEIAHSGIARKATDFVWSRTTINPKDTNWGRDALSETKAWLDQEEADYLADMGDTRSPDGDEAKRQTIASEAVVVIRGDDGVLWVLDGNHRTAQAVIFGIESIPALLGVKKPGVGRTPVDPSYKMGQRGTIYDRWRQRLANDPLKKIIEINGVKIGIEWPKGSTRTWKHLPGNDYEKLMKADYGYIRQTEGEDGEEIDVYAGPKRDSDLAFIVTQLDKETGEYDEDKIMLGYGSEAEAKASYLEHMEKAHFGGIKKLSWEKFLDMVPKSQRVKAGEEKTAGGGPGGYAAVLTDDLRAWPSPKDSKGSVVLPSGTRIVVKRLFKLDRGGSPEMFEIEYQVQSGLEAGYWKPMFVRAVDAGYAGVQNKFEVLPRSSEPDAKTKIEHSIIDLLSHGEQDLTDYMVREQVILDAVGRLTPEFTVNFNEAINELLKSDRVKWDPNQMSFWLAEKPEVGPESVQVMAPSTMQSKIDALLDQLALEQDPAKKKQIEQRIPSLSAGVKEIWKRRAGDTQKIDEQRAPGAVQECGHEWPGKKPGERGWCGRCRL